MSRTLLPSTVAVTGPLILVALVAGSERQAAAQARSVNEAPTYAGGVGAILLNNCASCHRPGQVAPMSLLTYEETRPWARAIRAKVADGTMPPWHADAPAGTFENDRRLTARDKDAIIRWVDAGAPKGDPRTMPTVPTFASTWGIGTPDLVLEMPEEYVVPPTGTIEYEHFYIPTNFTETKWVQAVEVLPGDHSVVHHAQLFYQVEQREVPAGGAIIQRVAGHAANPRQQGTRPRRTSLPSRLVAIYAPGTPPQIFRPGSAMRLEPGGTLELQMHYSTVGRPVTDRTRIGLVFAKEPPQQEVMVTNFFNGQFTIPAGAGNHRVDTEARLLYDSVVWGIFPHTHVRGKRWEYVVELPDGSRRPLLSVPNYDFNWQTYYMFKEPVALPKGARIVSSAWYDNSAKNPANPNPNVDVHWGDQTWEEMQYTNLMITVQVPASTSKR